MKKAGNDIAPRAEGVSKEEESRTHIRALRVALMDGLESYYASKSGQVFKAAYDKTLAAGVSVTIADNGGIYEVFPDGRRIFLMSCKPPMKVEIGARYTRRKDL